MLTFVKVEKRMMHLGNIFPFVSLRNLTFLGFNVMRQSTQLTLEGQLSSLDQSQETSVICWQLSCTRSLAAASWNGYPLKIEITVFATVGMKSVRLAFSLLISNLKFFTLFPSRAWHPGFPWGPKHLCLTANECWKSKGFCLCLLSEYTEYMFFMGFWFFFYVCESNTLILQVVLISCACVYWHFQSEIKAHMKCT